MSNRKQSDAWEKWRKENAKAFDSASLGTDKPEYYLFNRLWRAFMAGYDAGREEER